MRYAIIILGLILVVAFLAGIKAAQISSLIEFGQTQQAAGPPPEAVTTALAEAQLWEETLPAVGTVEALKSVALSNEEGDRMCSAMAGKDILFLRNHGVIVSGPTVAQTYDDLYYLERAAMVQVLAMQTGKPLHNIDAKLAEHTANQIADGEGQQALLHFESLKRLLDRDEPGWRRLAA